MKLTTLNDTVKLKMAGSDYIGIINGPVIILKVADAYGDAIEVCLTPYEARKLAKKLKCKAKSIETTQGPPGPPGPPGPMGWTSSLHDKLA